VDQRDRDGPEAAGERVAPAHVHLVVVQTHQAGELAVAFGDRETRLRIREHVADPFDGALEGGVVSIRKPGYASTIKRASATISSGFCPSRSSTRIVSR